MIPAVPAAQRRTAISTLLAAMWLALFPLWQDGSYTRITRSKWVGMLLFTAITVMAAVHLLRMRPRVRHRLGPLRHLALAYFALVALSAAIGTHRGALGDGGLPAVWMGAWRYEGLITQGCYLLIFLCMGLHPPDMRRLAGFTAAALLMYCAIAALQYAGVPLLYPAGKGILDEPLFQGPIGNIDMVAGYLAVALPLLLAAFALERKGGWLWFTAGSAGMLLTWCMQVQCGILALAALLASLLALALRRPQCRWRVGLILAAALATLALRMALRLPWLDGGEGLALHISRPAAALLIASAVLCALLPLARHRPGPSVPWHIILFLALSALVLALMAVYTLPLTEGSTPWQAQQMLHGHVEDHYAARRMGVWRCTLEMAPQLLLTGAGPDAFCYALQDHLTATGQSLPLRFDNPHSIPLAILANNGVFALIAFCALCALAIWRGLRRGCIPLGLAAGCYLVQGLFTFSLCIVTPLFYCVLGLIAASTDHKKGSPSHDE